MNCVNLKGKMSFYPVEYRFLIPYSSLRLGTKSWQLAWIVPYVVVVAILKEDPFPKVTLT